MHLKSQNHRGRLEQVSFLSNLPSFYKKIKENVVRGLILQAAGSKSTDMPVKLQTNVSSNERRENVTERVLIGYQII